MDGLKHILFSKNKNSEENKDLLKKKFLDELNDFAKNEPIFALKKLNSRLEGLNNNEVQIRLKQFGLTRARARCRRVCVPSHPGKRA